MANQTRKQRQPGGASRPGQKAQMRKKADIYQMNVERKNPNVTDYDRSEAALEHEMPDTRTEWLKEERQPNGLPAPTKESNSRSARRKVVAHAGQALRLARALYASFLPKMPPEAQSSLLSHQAQEFMGLPRQALANSLERIAVLQERYANENKVAAPPMMGEDEDLGEDMGEDMGMGDLDGLPEMDYSEEEMDAVPADSELLVCHPADSAPEMDLAPPADDLVPEMDLAPEAVEDDLVEEMPPLEGEASRQPVAGSDDLMDQLADKILARLQDRRSSKKVARDPGHWEDSVQDVDQPSEDYHDLDAADYYESGSNSEKAEDQWDLSNPIAASLSRFADGETSVSDPGGLNPFNDEEGYHDVEDHSYEEKPMSVKFERQMEKSNPVDGLKAPSGGQKDASSDEDLLRYAVASLSARGLPEELQPQVPTRRAPAAKRVARQASAAPKRGAKTLAGLGRTASSKKRDDIDELSGLWRNAPKVDL